MALRRISKRRRGAPRRRFAKRRAPLRKRPALKRMIRREISRNTENKTIQKYIYSKNLYGVKDSTAFPSENVFPVGPDPASLVINQGTGQGERIGNQIKTKRLILRGTILPLPYNATTNVAVQPVQGKIWIFYDKTIPTSLPNPIATPNFFQNGSTAKGFEDDLTDLWSPVNTDRYRVLTTRSFKVGFANYGGSGSVPAQQSYSNNDFKLNVNFKINLTKYYPKRVKFQDAQTVPTTRGLFCMVTYHLANGGAVPFANAMLNLQYMQDYQFEDA